jgi:enoyl-CoA hydratase
MDVILTGRRLSAVEAEAAGIVARVVQLADLDTEARAVADEIAARSTIAQRLAKETVSRSFDLTLEAGLEHERRAFALALSSDDATEGITAFLEKRPPEWTHH